MYLAAGEFFKAADVMIENGWVDRYMTERLLYMLYEIANQKAFCTICTDCFL